MAGDKQVSVFDYSDYRSYLKDKFAELKAGKKQWSYRYFAKKAGITSPSFLLLVMENKRNLTRESTFKFSRALDHNKKEHEFFENLVFLDQSKSLKEKNYYFEKVAQNKKFLSVKQVQKLEYDYFTNWYIPVVREMVELADFHEDPEWIARRLAPPISIAEAGKALRVLKQLGFIHDENGRLVKKDASLTTESEVVSISIKNYHEKMIELAGESLQRFPSGQRNVTSLTLGITEELFLKIKERMIEFGNEILSMATSDDRTEKIYQFNLQLFPLLRPSEEKHGKDE